MAVAQLQRLHAERAALQDKGNALAAAAAEAGAYTPVMRAERDKLISGISTLDVGIERETAARAEILAAPARVVNDDGTTSPITGARQSTGKRYADMFGQPKGNGGFKTMDEYLSTVAIGMADTRLQAAMTTNVGADGGFFVPEEYAADLLDGSLEDEIVRPRATVWPMNSDTRKVAGFDGSDHTNGSIFGLVGRWIGEATTNTVQMPKATLKELIAKKLAIYALSSNELIADGLTFEQMLQLAMKAAMAFELDTAFLTGSGAGKPLGVLHDPALITVAKETGQSAGSIIYNNLTKMFARLHPSLMAKSVWVANVDTIPELSTLSLAVGTGGVPVMTQGADGTFSILTRPVIFTEKVPTLGTVGDIMLCEFSQYSIGLRKEVTFDKANTPGWYEDESAYRTILRVDGQGRWTAPLTPRNGATLSWCVALATRS